MTNTSTTPKIPRSLYTLARFASLILLPPALLLGLTVALLAPAPTPAHAVSILRVSPTGATSGACGSDWSNPCALTYALQLATPGSQIWVKAGVHKPGTNRSDSVPAQERRAGLRRLRRQRDRLQSA